MTDYNDLKSKCQSLADHNYCSLISVCAATGETLDDVYAAFELVGRKHRKGVTSKMIRDAVELLGYQAIYGDIWKPDSIITNYCQSYYIGRIKRYTPLTINKILSDGNYILNMKGHVAALIDGQIIDWTEDRRNRILGAWKII